MNRRKFLGGLFASGVAAAGAVAAKAAVDPEKLEAAAEALGVPPEQVLVAGADVTKDGVDVEVMVDSSRLTSAAEEAADRLKEFSDEAVKASAEAARLAAKAEPEEKRPIIGPAVMAITVSTESEGAGRSRVLGSPESYGIPSRVVWKADLEVDGVVPGFGLYPINEKGEPCGAVTRVEAKLETAFGVRTDVSVVFFDGLPENWNANNWRTHGTFFRSPPFDELFAEG